MAIYIGGYESISPEFEKEYPEIKVIAVVARGSDLAQRVLSERRADKFIADVVRLGRQRNHSQQLLPAKVLDPMAQALILPEVTDESKWYLGKHQYYDPNAATFLTMLARQRMAISTTILTCSIRKRSSPIGTLPPEMEG